MLKMFHNWRIFHLIFAKSANMTKNIFSEKFHHGVKKTQNFMLIPNFFEMVSRNFSSKSYKQIHWPS
jgi:hypothetical protein